MSKLSKKYLVNEHTAGLRGGLRAYRDDFGRRVGPVDDHIFDTDESYRMDRDDGAPSRSKIDPVPKDRDARHNS